MYMVRYNNLIIIYLKYTNNRLLNSSVICCLYKTRYGQHNIISGITDLPFIDDLHVFTLTSMRI